MITILRSFGNVVGAEWTAVFWAVWLFLYLTICLLFRRGRRLWIIGCGFLSSEILCDGTWLAYFYPDGIYRNPGLAGMGILIIWPLLLILAAAIFLLVPARKQNL